MGSEMCIRDSPIIVYFLFSEKLHWSIWPSVFACVIGGYFLSDINNVEVRFGDALVLIGAIFWALHIIYIGRLVSEFDMPFSIALLQNLVVATLSLFLALAFEKINFENSPSTNTLFPTPESGNTISPSLTLTLS